MALAQKTSEERPPKATILHHDGNIWKQKKQGFDPKTISSLISNLPDRCYIFLRKEDYPEEGDQRKALLDNFGVPKIVATKAVTDLNGYFGCQASYGDDKKVNACSTWFRCLVKMVRKERKNTHENGIEYVMDAKERYTWYEMGYFTFWKGNTCRVLCVDTPRDLPEKLEKNLEPRSPSLEFRDPFAMHTELLDQIVLYYEISVWRVRDPVRNLEKSRSHLRNNAFQEMHDISRHAIHKFELLSVTIETMRELQKYQTEVHEGLPDDLKNKYAEHAKSYSDFQIQLVKSLQLRSESNKERLENEVSLAFNNLAHQDNTVMKSIALLTMIFFPATFFSSLFSTTFFTYGEKGFEASSRLWIYWAITAPVTAVVLMVYALWFFYSRLMGVLRKRDRDAADRS